MTPREKVRATIILGTSTAAGCAVGWWLAPGIGLWAVPIAAFAYVATVLLAAAAVDVAEQSTFRRMRRWTCGRCGTHVSTRLWWVRRGECLLCEWRDQVARKRMAQGGPVGRPSPFRDVAAEQGLTGPPNPLEAATPADVSAAAEDVCRKAADKDER